MHLPRRQMKSTSKETQSKKASPPHSSGLLLQSLASAQLLCRIAMSSHPPFRSSNTPPTACRACWQHGARARTASEIASSSGSRRIQRCCQNSAPEPEAAAAATAVDSVPAGRDRSHRHFEGCLRIPWVSPHTQWVCCPEGCQSCQADRRIVL